MPWWNKKKKTILQHEQKPNKVVHIHVKPGNLGALHGWSTKVPVRVVKRVQIMVKDGNAVG
jgi:hypothetical protein